MLKTIDAIDIKLSRKKDEKDRRFTGYPETDDLMYVNYVIPLTFKCPWTNPMV